MDVRGRSGPFDQKIIYVRSRSTKGHAELDAGRSPEIRGAPSKQPGNFQIALVSEVISPDSPAPDSIRIRRAVHDRGCTIERGRV